MLLCIYGSFSKVSHIARTSPPTIATDELGLSDQDVMNCLTECLATEMALKAREQAQLSLRHDELGFRSLVHHCSAAYIASVSSTGSPLATNNHLLHALTALNANVISMDALTIVVIIDHPHQQHFLSSKLEAAKLHHLLNNNSAADKARLLSVSSAYMFMAVGNRIFWPRRNPCCYQMVAWNGHILWVHAELLCVPTTCLIL